MEISDFSWKCLKDKDITSTIGLQSSIVNATPYINALCERIRQVESHDEAIDIIFTLTQKVSYIYFSPNNFYDKELGRRLNISLRFLLKERLKCIKGDSRHD